MRVYNSIDDLPIYNYWRILEEKVLDHLAIELPKSINEEAKKKKLSDVWEKIEGEMIDLKLQDKDFVGSMKSEARFMVKKIRAALTNSPADLLIVKAEEKKYEKYSESKFDFRQSLFAMSKYMGYRVDPKKTTVSEYYMIATAMKREYSAIKK